MHPGNPFSIPRVFAKAKVVIAEFVAPQCIQYDCPGCLKQAIHKFDRHSLVLATNRMQGWSRRPVSQEGCGVFLLPTHSVKLQVQEHIEQAISLVRQAKE